MRGAMVRTHSGSAFMQVRLSKKANCLFQTSFKAHFVNWLSKRNEFFLEGGNNQYLLLFSWKSKDFYFVMSLNNINFAF